MSRSFTYECGCCGSTMALRQFALPEGWVLIKGKLEDVLMCSHCAAEARKGCDHADEKAMPLAGMRVQCQRCGRERNLVMR